MRSAQAFTTGATTSGDRTTRFSHCNVGGGLRFSAGLELVSLSDQLIETVRQSHSDDDHKHWLCIEHPIRDHTDVEVDVFEAQVSGSAPDIEKIFKVTLRQQIFRSVEDKSSIALLSNTLTLL